MSKIKAFVFTDSVKWAVAFLLSLILILVHYVYYEFNLYVKVLSIVIFMLFMLTIVFTSTIGRYIIVFGKEVYLELKKVIWPTCQNSFSTTLVVIAVTVIISVILWGLDTILVNLISLGLRL